MQCLLLMLGLHLDMTGNVAYMHNCIFIASELFRNIYKRGNE